MIYIVGIGDKRVDPKDVQFTLFSDGKIAGLYLFIPDFRENDDTRKQIGYLMLDEALGEFDVETRLGLIKMLAPEGHTAGERHPLLELPRLFDQLTMQLRDVQESQSVDRDVPQTLAQSVVAAVRWFF